MARLRVRSQRHLYVRIDRRHQAACDGASAGTGLLDRRPAHYFYATEGSSLRPAVGTASRWNTTCSPVSVRRATSVIRATTRSSSKEPQVHPCGDSQAARVRNRSSAGRVFRTGWQSRCPTTINELTGEVLLQCNEELTEAKLEELRQHNISAFKVLFIDGLNVGSYLRDTLIADRLDA